MISYPSIETVWKRNAETHKLDFGVQRMPETALIKQWRITEKVDGMNMRVIVSKDTIDIRGRTDNAQIAADLRHLILAAFTENERMVDFRLGLSGDEPFTFYGEGYGAGIQKGSIYSTHKNIIFFDVMTPGGRWMEGQEAREFVGSFSLPFVPDLGVITALPRTQDDLRLLISESIVANWQGNEGVVPEGIVAKPDGAVLLNSRGERVMWKLTNREFK